MDRRRAKQLSWYIPLHCIRIWAENAIEGDSVFWSYLHQFAIKMSLQPMGICITLRRKPAIERVGKHWRLSK
nr:MAG TPA: hypothetical protein [Caudoviricetes sp.]